MEEEIDFEQRRVRHMEAENRKRERNLARVAARAVSSFSAEGDGNLRAMRVAEQLESEAAVWQVKNVARMPCFTCALGGSQDVLRIGLIGL